MLTIILSVAVIMIGATAIGLVAKRVGAFDYDDSPISAPRVPVTARSNPS